MAVELEKINFNDFQEPAVGAENLNKLQDNIENAINEGAGNISDTTNIDDKVTNTYSARIIDELTGIETIENENGTAIKYPDGRMECIISKKVTDMAINSQYGALYIGIYTLNYPVPFIKIPYANCGTLWYGTSASWGTVQSSSIDKVVVRGYDYYSRAIGTETIIRVFAKGYWK